MAAKNTTPKIRYKRSSSCLPSCFLASPVSDPDTESPVSRVGSGLKVSWFSWSRFRRKKKTVPLDAPLQRNGGDLELKEVTKQKANRRSYSLKLPKGKSSRSRGSKQQDAIAPQVHVSNEPQNPARLPHITTKYDTRNQPAHSGPGPPRTGPRTTHPGSPEPYHRTASIRKTRSRRYGATGRLDPGVGLSVLAVTLAVIVLFGRAWAIFCMCTWFYLTPRLRAAADSGGRNDSGEIDTSSEEYKKKVILEGLLERKGRKLAGTR